MGLVRGLGGARQPAFTSKDALKSEVLPGRSTNRRASVLTTAEDLVATFCEDVPLTRVAPSHVELEAFWSRCSTLNPALVANAISGQLASAIGAHVWQPQLRALHVVEHLHRHGGDVGRAATAILMTDAAELVKHISTEVPECQEAARRVLELWEFGEAVSLATSTDSNHGADAPASLRALGPPDSPASGATVPEERRSVLESADLICLSGDLISFSVSPAPEASAAPPHATLEAERSPLSHENLAAMSDLDPALIEVFLALKTPERFDIGGGETTRENPELNKMFSFSPATDPVGSVPLATDELVTRHVRVVPDPFDFVADHMALV